MILFAINTGLRTNEIFNLKWEDLNLDERTINLIVKKNQKLLSLPMNDTALGIVEHRQKHGPYVFYNPMTGDRFKDVKASPHRSSQTRRARACHLAYVPSHLRFPAHPQRRRYRDGEGAARAFQYQCYYAVRPFESGNQADRRAEDNAQQ